MVEAMMIHLQRLNELPHISETQLVYHMRLAQLASIQGQTDRANQEWQLVEALRPAVPESTKYLESARQTIGYPPLLQHPLSSVKADLGDIIRFEGFTLRPGQTVRPGDVIRLTLFWHAVQRPPASYTVFIHVYDKEGNKVFQDDFLPTPHTSDWWPGDSVWQERTFSVPTEMKPGEYRVYTGMHLLATLERLPVRAQPSNDNSIFLATLQVK
jgi:hypothetical protein